MDVEAIFAGIGAIITAAAGVSIVIREFRRRDRVAMQKANDEMSDEIATLRKDLLDFRRFAFAMAQLLTDHGIDPPPIPTPHHLLPDE